MTDETGYNHPTTLSTGSLEDADLELPDSITEAEIADEAVTEPKIADDAVTENKIVALAVTAGKIAAGAITTAKLAADAVIAYVLNVGGTVQIDEDGIYVTDGAIVVENSGATVIIDGESNMFKIAASGTLQFSAGVVNSPGNSTTETINIATGFTYQPAFLSFVLLTTAFGLSRGIYGMTVANDGKVIDIWESWVRVVNTNETQFAFKETTSRNTGTTQAQYTSRYYILQEAAF